MARRRRRKFHFEELERPLERPDPTAEAEHAEEEKTKDPQAGAEHAAAGPQAQVLELQKTAGNRAVGAVLDRWTHPVLAPGSWPKQKQLVFDGKVVPLESVSQGAGSHVAHPGSGSGKPKPDEFAGPGELSVVIPSGGWSQELFRQFEGGEVFKTVEVVVPTADGKGMRLILAVVEITGFASHGGGDHPLEMLTLSFRKRTFTQNPPPE